MTLLLLAGPSDSLWAWVLLGAGAVAAEGPAREPPPRPAASSLTPASPRDLELTVQARKVLRRDEKLGEANVQVLIRDGNAVLSGRVPSKELIDRAVKAVRDVPGVFGVRSELLVVLPPPPPLFGPEKEQEPTRTTAASPPRDPLSPGTLTNRLPPPAPLRRPGEKPAGVVLQPPVAVRGEEVRPERTVSRGGETDEPSSLAKQIDKIRQGDRRFAPIRTEVRGRVVVVRGGAPGEVLMAFLDALRSLDGVDEVLLNQNPPRRR